MALPLQDAPARSGSSATSRISVKVPLTLLIGLAFTLAAFSFWGFNYSGLESFQSNEIAHRMFDPGQESSIYTALSVIAMGCAGLAWFLSGILARRARLTWSWGWFFISLLLFAFAIDESAQIHEELATIGDMFLGNVHTFSWLAIGIPAALLLIVLVLIAGWHIPRRAMHFLLAGLVIFFSGAVGMELVMSTYLSEPGNVYWDLPAIVFYHVEEFLELSGIIVIMLAPFRAMTAATPRGGTGTRAGFTQIRIDNPRA